MGFDLTVKIRRVKGCPKSEVTSPPRQTFLGFEMSPINICYLHSFSVKLQHVRITHTTMALRAPVNPAQQTRAIVALEAGLYLIVSVSRDM